MPTYMLDCAEKCGRTTPVELDYINLDQEQLDLINQGETFPLYPYNAPPGVSSLPEEDDDFYLQVCPHCGSDQP